MIFFPIVTILCVKKFLQTLVYFSCVIGLTQGLNYSSVCGNSLLLPQQQCILMMLLLYFNRRLLALVVCWLDRIFTMCKLQIRHVALTTLFFFFYFSAAIFWYNSSSDAAVCTSQRANESYTLLQVTEQRNDISRQLNLLQVYILMDSNCCVTLDVNS